MEWLSLDVSPVNNSVNNSAALVVELYHHAQPHSNKLDFESRNREKKKNSFRINERSLIENVKRLHCIFFLFEI